MCVLFRFEIIWFLKFSCSLPMENCNDGLNVFWMIYAIKLSLEMCILFYRKKKWSDCALSFIFFSLKWIIYKC